MKILAIQGSPRLDGNTQAVLDIVLQAAEQAGGETTLLWLSQLDDLSGCRECNACQTKPDEPGCPIQDGMQPWLNKVLENDVIVWATPVFCWSPSWLVKMATDRCHCYFKQRKDGEITSLIEGRKIAAVITAGGGPNDGADLVQETYRRLAGFGKCNWLGALVAANVKSVTAIRADQDLTARAQQFGRQLTA